nr:uncharacterized protein CTRU02_06461 [Colletotrichum truncatum]KAF6792965.1 hypothetical protein CTRU02_06461 [Colletotrichum truncatum]
MLCEIWKKKKKKKKKATKKSLPICTNMHPIFAIISFGFFGFFSLAMSEMMSCGIAANPVLHGHPGSQTSRDPRKEWMDRWGVARSGKSVLTPSTVITAWQVIRVL